MFQTFDAPSDAAAIPERIKRLRVLLADEGLAALLLPRGDEHQGEYVAPCSERLRWLTGFSGSAGLVAVTRRHAGLFVDGRYTVQARAECGGGLFEFPGLARTGLPGWLRGKLKSGDTVGFDPWLHTVSEIERLGETLKAAGIALKPTRRNLVDAIWGKERPRPPDGPIVPHLIRYAGRSAESKIAAVQKALKEAGQDAVILTQPDSVCWLFNIRGRDVAHNPVVLAFAIVPAAGKPELFVAAGRITREAQAQLDGAVKISPPAALRTRVQALRKAGRRVRLDADRGAWWFVRALGKSAVRGADPCVPMKAIKNATEIKGARTAHIRDGAAVVRFLAWLDRAVATGEEIDEIGAVRALEAQRAGSQALREISFDTISGSGPNGAIVHYRVTEASNRRLKAGELFLLDSGAQYLEGTTDITRTIAIGAPSDEMRERFTLVLKGHISVAMARFPKGTRGIDLDPFARRALWEHGLDYDHGTGHGVGSYLSVHEGPQSISRAGMAAIEPGMIISNEPGYYKEGHYGIRIENLVLVTEPVRPDGGDRDVMGFETLTLVPIDRRLIVKALLSPNELRWIDTYHAQVNAVIGPEVDAPTLRWLEAATKPL
ncbi:aminopeptidase P family protein [Hyphomicrobium sp.]|uniref:aminopeptidase P family protein n=1 Tax=Hyphomicrobium sp. TaxID=82 RepID=UPI0025C60FD3|nr:aminopeptidase P family protein [Hyphomicrobium sp.]MCC7252861.1 aminopeptidase P family protein [Hyphomicrobium sp.]